MAIIIDVEIKGNGTDSLYITYRDPNKEESYVITSGEVFSVIYMKNDDDDDSTSEDYSEYRLIETQEQLSACMEDGHCGKCIFLIDIDYADKTISEEVDFSSSIFVEKMDCRSTSFSKEIIFKGASFVGELDFEKASFTQDAYFTRAYFNKEVNFKETCFTKDANFEAAHFEKNIDFSETEFKKSANFKEVYFKGQTDFSEIEITEQANFTKSIFFNKVWFPLANFFNNTNFTNSKFKEDVKFNSSMFQDQADFKEAEFEQRADFTETNFAKKLDFTEAHFRGNTCFLFSKINHLRFHKINAGEQADTKFILDLMSAEIEYMDYVQANIGQNNIANTETALLLKHIASEQHDQRTASKFHKYEMYKYYEDLKGNKTATTEHRVQDLVIVSFERWVSNFGTNPWRAILCLLAVNIILVFVGNLGGHVFHISNFKVAMSMFKWKLLEELVQFIFIYFLHERFDSLSLVHYLAFIINPILLYEIIKSFRKYSRKL